MTVHAKTPDDFDPAHSNHLTPGKEYRVYGDDGRGFFIRTQDDRELFCLWEGCAHLGRDKIGLVYKNWVRVERPDVTPDLRGMTDRELAHFALSHRHHAGLLEEIGGRWLQRVLGNSQSDLTEFFTTENDQ